MKLALIKCDGLGDGILLLPYIYYLKKRYRFSIDIFCNTKTFNFYNKISSIDNVFTSENIYDNNTSYEILLNLQYSRTEDSDRLAHSIYANKKFAFKGDYQNQKEINKSKNDSYYNDLIDIPSFVPEIVKYKIFFSFLFKERIKSFFPYLLVPNYYKYFAIDFFNRYDLKTNNTLVFFSGAGAKHRSSTLYKNVLERFTSLYDINILALGSSEDYEINSINLPPGRKFINLSGKTSIWESISIINQTRATLGPETGLTHIACALNKPNASILGGGHFGRFFPYSNTSSIACNFISCFYCNWYCTQPEYSCLEDIAENSIYKALESAWNFSQPKHIDIYHTLSGKIHSLENILIKKYFHTSSLSSNSEILVKLSAKF